MAAPGPPTVTARTAVKAGFLLSEGQVHVRTVDPDRGWALATVGGESGDYVVRRFARGSWSCLGASFGGGDCSHRWLCAW
jgi:hypothetical protein